MGEHSKLGASSMHRWSACPGSVRLCEGITPIESEAAALGSYVHTLCERVLHGEDIFTVCKGPDKVHYDSVKLYVDTIMEDFIFSQSKELFIEERVDLSPIHPGCFGTLDAYFYDPMTNKVFLYDYKNGKSVVEVEGNQQLLFYALGIAIEVKFPLDQIECVVVQPNARTKGGAVRRWKFPTTYLMNFEIEMIRAAKRTEDFDAPLIMGRHCYFCAAKTVCPAQRANADKKAMEVFK